MARKRETAAKSVTTVREFIAAGVGRAQRGPGLESALCEMATMEAVAQHVPGLEKEAALLRGAGNLSALLAAVRDPLYLGGRAAAVPVDDAAEWIEVTLDCAPEDVRWLIGSAAQLSHSAQYVAGSALDSAVATALEEYYSGEEFPLWSELLLDAKSFDARVDFKSWRAALVIVVPAETWFERLSVLQRINPWLGVKRIAG